MERLFLDNFLKNSRLIYELLVAAQAKVREILLIHGKKWHAKAGYSDLVFFRDSTLPIFSMTGNTNLVNFLIKVKDNTGTSEDLKGIFQDKMKHLSEYSGSVKDNEEILCLALKYVQYFDKTHSSLLNTGKDDETNVEKIYPTQPVPDEGNDEVVNNNTELPDKLEDDDKDDGNDREPDGNIDLTQKDVDNDNSTDNENSTNGLYAIESLVQSMTSPDENVWFKHYSQYLEGKPRRMTRIVNIYNVTRGIAEEVLGLEAMTKKFLQNLIQIIILVELWPYRMSWLFKMAENACEEETLKTVTEENHLVMKSTGCSMEEVMKKLVKTNGTEKMVEIASRIPLYKAYQKVSGVLMYSPQTFERQMAQDSDPQLFELLLLEKDFTRGKMLMMSDIIPLYHYNEAKKRNEHMEHTLQPFIFNMQSHMFEKASKSMENILIHIEVKKDNIMVNTPSQNEEDEWEIKYEHIGTYFEKGKKAPGKLLEGATSAGFNRIN